MKKKNVDKKINLVNKFTQVFAVNSETFFTVSVNFKLDKIFSFTHVV